MGAGDTREEAPKPRGADEDRRERRFSLGVLALLSVAFLAYSAVFVPRLGNAHFGDLEFSGWSGPMGSRLLSGDRPYLDFILPIPPGSFALLAALEWVLGKPLLMTELWLNSVIHLGMAWLAYAMVAPLTARRNALLVGLCTLITIVQLNKECAYDHTAQLVAWGSFVTGVRALLADAERKRARLWVATGFLAGVTLLFKQSTALGAVAAWIVCLVYLGAVEGLSRQREPARALVGDAAALGRGVAYGLATTWAAVIALGSTGSAFFEATFLDASVLKGGLALMARNVAGYLFSFPAYPGSLLLITMFLVVVLMAVGRRGRLGMGDEPVRASPLSKFDVAFLPLAAVTTFGGAAALLVFGPAGYPFEWIIELDRLKQLPSFGLVFAATFFVAHVARVPERTPSAPFRQDAARVAHVLNALWLGALVCTILHNTSAPEFRPFYDNNPIIPLAFLAFLVALDRAGARWLQVVVVALMMLSLGGNRFYRAMIATERATPGTHWAGMQLGPRGAVIDTVAERVRELTTPTDTVLVLPEDVQLTSRIGRPRPALAGAILFVDQYPPRLAASDISRLDEHPPKVIVMHPSDARRWQRFFRIWSGNSGAEQVLRHVLAELLPSRYRRVETYSTVFNWEPAALEIYVREDRDAEKTASAEGVDVPRHPNPNRPETER